MACPLARSPEPEPARASVTPANIHPSGLHHNEMAEAAVADADGSSRMATAKAVAGTIGSYLQVGGGVAASYLKEKATTVASATVSAVASATSSNGADVSLRALGSAEVLKVAATLDGIFSSGDLGVAGNMEVPRLVVVGTQSSGKSSLLNGIMGADILPLGEQMTTRAPLSLQLVHNSDASAMRAEFGDFVAGQWVAEESIALQCPDPTAAQLAGIRAAIETQTAKRAGTQKGVSTNPIFLRLFSPHVPNLNLCVARCPHHLLTPFWAGGPRPNACCPRHPSAPFGGCMPPTPSSCLPSHRIARSPHTSPVLSLLVCVCVPPYQQGRPPRPDDDGADGARAAKGHQGADPQHGGRIHLAAAHHHPHGLPRASRSRG